MAKDLRTVGEGMLRREVVTLTGPDADDLVMAWARRNHAAGPFHAACERNVETAKEVLKIMDGLPDKPTGHLESYARRIVETHRNAATLLAAGNIDGGMAAAYRLGALIGEARQVLRWSETVTREQNRTEPLVESAKNRSAETRRRDDAWLQVALAKMAERGWSVADTARWVARNAFVPQRSGTPLSERQIRRIIGAAAK